MPSKYRQGVYQPKDTKKYRGNGYPIYRSEWEYRVFEWLDKTKEVLSWSSEAFAIPYIDPFDGRQRKYIPDLLIEYIDKNGRKHVELIEIKPFSQTVITEKSSQRDAQQFLINQSKWESAKIWCHKNGIGFRVITERDIFVGSRRKK